VWRSNIGKRKLKSVVMTDGSFSSSRVVNNTRIVLHDSYLVDPASSHMLVSKIKPCMSKYKRYTVKLRLAH